MANFLQLLSDAANRAADPAGMNTLENTPASPPLASATKTASLEAASQQKMLNVGGRSVAAPTPADQYRGVAADMSGNGQGSAGEVEQDLATMQPYQLRQKYGDEQAMSLILGQATARAQYRGDTTGSRTDSMMAADTVTSVGMGLANAVGGIGALAMGAADDGAGVSAAKKLAELNEFAQGTQSVDMQGRRRAMEARQALSTRDTTQQYEKDIEAGESKLISSFKRIGKDVLSAVDNATDDSVTFGEGVSQGIGSLLAAGPLSKAVTSVAGVGSKVAVPVAIGAMEGGGAYQQTTNDVSKMSFESLAKESPYFNELVAEGMTPEQARDRVANRTGMLSAAIQAPVAAATGTLVSRFEGNPFAVPSVRTALGNIGRETLEEGIQSGTGQTAQNLAVQTLADKSQELSEGVGENIGQGALYGLGTAGVIQTPGVAARTGMNAAMNAGAVTMMGASAAGSVLGAVTKPAADWLVERGEKIMEQNKKASPVSDEAVQQAAAETVQTAPEAEAILRDGIEKASATPEEKAEANAYVDELLSAARIDPVEAETARSEITKGLIGESTNRVELLQKMADLLNIAPEGSNTHFDLALDFYDTFVKYAQLMERDVAAMTALPKEHRSIGVLKEYDTLTATIQNTPKVRRALRTVNEMMARAQEENRIQPVTEESIATPEGQANIRNAISVAEIAPDKADPEINRQMLLHATQGRIQLTPQQKSAIQASIALVDAARAYDATAEAQGFNRAQDIVSKEIKSDESQKDPSAFSALQHTRGVLAAMKAGNRESGEARLADFGKFAQHMQNKVAALNQHLNAPEKGAVTYMALQKDRSWKPAVTGLYVNTKSDKSVEIAQQMAAEAKMLADVYQNLKQAFPDLTAPEVFPVQLNPVLDGPFKEVTAQFRAKTRSVKPAPAAPVTPDPAPVAEVVTPQPAPVADPIRTVPAPVPVEQPLPVVDVPDTDIVPVEPDLTPSPIRQPFPKSEVVEPAKTGIEAVFPDLVPNNKFTEAFRMPSQARTRTIGTGDPLNVVRDAMASGKNYSSFVGSELAREYTPELAKAYSEYLKNAPAFVRELKSRLNDFLNKKKGDKASLAEQFANGTEVNRWLSGKVLNITEPTNNGFEYNQELLENSVLAGMQWLLVADQFGSLLDAKDVAGIADVGVEQISDGVVELLNQGMSPVEAVNSLGDKITQYWGLNTNRNAPEGYTKGIPYAMAAEVLRVMVDADLIEVLEFNLDDQGRIVESGGKTILRYVPRGNKKIGEKRTKENKASPMQAVMESVLESVNEFPGAIDAAVLIDPVPVNYIGDAIPAVADTQLHNSFVENTAEQKEAIRREQETPYFIDTMMAGFYEALGVENINTLFANGSFDPDQYNINEARSLDGKNRTTIAAFNHLMGLIKEVGNAAAVRGESLDQVPIRFAMNMTRLGRLQMMGKYNPQASKLVREAVLPTRSTINVNDRTAYKSFALALAQGLGVKVHKMLLDESIQKVEGMLKGDLAESVSLVQEWMKNQNTSLPESIANTIKENFTKAGADLTTVGLHSLVEYARYDMADKAARNKFTTTMYVEADGVTNGPINAMRLLSRGAFLPEWIRNMAKGGLFLGTPNRTMNEHNKADSKDMYQATTDSLRNMLQKLRSGLVDNPDVSDQLSRLDDLMDLFMPNFNYENGVLQLDRGIAKNPLTITIYGSGAAGIAGKMVQTLTGEIYSQMSKAHQARLLDSSLTPAEAMFGKSPDSAAKFIKYQNSINALTDLVTVKRKDGLKIEFADKGKKRGGFDPQTFTFQPEELRALQQNMLHLFVTPLRDAITENVGQPLMESADILRKATQVQSIFLQFAFQREVEKLLETKKKDPNWVPGDFLSREEMDGLFSRLKHMAPVIDTGDQKFFIAGSQSIDMKSAELARSLDDKLRTNAFVSGPMDSGVSGVPIMVIGSGDGKAMQHLSVMKDAPVGSLKIFDGVNFKLTTLMDDSRKANEAIAESWKGNPMRAVLESYSAFMKDLSFKDVDEAQIKLLGKSLLGPKGAEATTKDIFDEMKSLQFTLEEAALSIDARNEVLSTVAQSIDQMAAAGQPFQVEGDVLNLTPEKMADELNARYEKVMLKKRKTAFPTDKIAPEIAKVGRAHRTGVRELSFTALRNLSKLTNLPADQKGIFNEILRSLGTKEYKVVAGTADQIRAYNEQTGKAPIPTENTMGATIIGEKIIYLINPSSETLVHELVHASTFESVLGHYEGTSDPAVKGAVERIEVLMAQFLSLGDQLVQVGPEMRKAYSDAQAAINGHLNNSNQNNAVNKAAALNEFMAWGLTNESLARLQKRNEANPLVRLAKDVFAAIKKLIWGRKAAPALPGADMFSNLVFNSSIIIRSQPSVQALVQDTILFQSSAYGESDRLSEIDQAFHRKVSAFLDQPLKRNEVEPRVRLSDAQQQAQKIAHSAQAHGFGMTMQEASTFRMIVAALATEAEIDPLAMAKATDLYRHVVKTLKVEDFMTDPESNDPNDRYFAQERYNVIMGNYLTETDAKGRSSLMPTFLALAITNEGFRDVLSKMDMPTRVLNGWGTLDGALEDLGNQAMDKLSDRLAGLKKPANVQNAIDNLTAQIVDVAQDREAFIDKVSSPIGDAIDKANQFLIDGMEDLSNAALDKAQQLEDAGGRINETIASAARIGAAIVNEQNAQRISEGIMSQANKAKLWKGFHDFLNDVIGRTASNARIYDMIKGFRTLGQQDRQQYREILPTVIASKFSRSLEAKEWTAMFNAMGKTDLAALESDYSPSQIFDLLKDSNNLDAEIMKLESTLQNVDPDHFNTYKRKMIDLAQFMATGETSHNLLRNAYAITNLFDENKKKGWSKKNANFEKTIDQLTSLYALERTSVNDRDTLSFLVQEESDGVQFTLHYLVGQRVEEMRKAAAPLAKANQYKGYVPSEQQQGLGLIIANDNESAELAKRGFTNVGSYGGSSADRFAGKMSYYFSPISGRATYNQGILQNVRQSAGGVDVATGFTMGMNAGHITDQQTIKRIQKFGANVSATEHLLPVRDENGKVIAYERSVDPRQLARLNNNTNLSEMIGVWRGRQVEEAKSQMFNEALIDAMHDMYKKDLSESASNQAQYVDLLAPKSYDNDPVITDAMSLMTPETFTYMKKKFGDSFYVRKDMLNDAMGYRSASIGDAWTGNSRWSPETQERVQKMAMGIFGNKAYERFVSAEKTLQNFVQDARVLIAVKSVIVPMSNLISNVFQLTGRGVPLVDTLRNMPRKASEIDNYVKSRIRQIEAEAELRAAAGNVVAERKLTDEIQAITDGHKRLSIWPLIQAGEFSSISDASVSREDIMLSEGRLSEFVDAQVNKLPKGLQTMGRYALITKDTALFQGLQKAVTYGDFLAKAVLYDDLTKRQKKSKEYALGRVSEEFVNYDRLSGRSRGYLESVGLLWFYNFKIRSAKVAMSMIRNNPVHTLLATIAPAPTLFGSVGLPTEDNMFSKLIDGSIDYSMGMGQGMRAPMLNPWVNLVH